MAQESNSLKFAVGDFAAALPHLWPVVGYAVITFCGAVWLFLRQMKRQ